MPAALFNFAAMMKCAPWWRPFLFFFLACTLLGCSDLKRGSAGEDKDPHVLEGRRRLKGYDWNGAVQSFERALQSNPNNAVAHLELGILYEQKRQDFGAAIYHYQRHLSIHPESHFADPVKQAIVGCKRELAKTVSYAVLDKDIQNQLERLSQTNALLRQRIEFLETELHSRPQYITQTVTNFVRWEDPVGGSGSRLTTPTEIVQRPSPAPPTQQAQPTPSPAPQQARQAQRETVAAAPRSAPPARAQQPQPRAQPAAEKPKPRPVHTVRPGETLQVLASKYGVSLAKLRAANPSAARGVRAGQKIVIPER